MSSFRIDRQYVAFETAETQPVFATSQAEKPAAEPEAETAADISKLYDEIYERLQREHAEQAENMLSKAADDADAIIGKAKKQAEELLCQAAEEAAKMKEARIAELEAAAAKREKQIKTELLELETKLRDDYTVLVDEMRGKVIALVMEIVRKVVGIKLAESDEIFSSMIRDALDRLKQTGTVLIRVSPEDYARYFGNARGGAILEGLDTGDMKITAVEEPSFSQGDLIVESESEMVDLSINRQIGLIEDAFTN